MGNLIVDDVSKMIARRKKRKFYKKSLLLLLLLLSVMITLCLKLPGFNIKEIEVLNNKNISSNEIIKSSGISIGNNIFYISIKKAQNAVLENPYILNTEIKRKLPNKIIINITERKAVFYGKLGQKYLIIDSNGVALEEKSSISKMNLVKLEGFDLIDCKVGEPISNKDSRKTDVINVISRSLSVSKDNFGITLVNVSDCLNIKAYKGNMCIKLGNKNDMEEKLNKALNILQKNELKGAKGYIDVSYKGNPVVFIEK